jgi:hypothetical protein
MSHPSKTALLGDARRLGYDIVVYFVGLETAELSIGRVRQRVAMGGHPVPTDKIRQRFERCLNLLPDAIRLCDRAVLFDNSYRDDRDERVRMVPFCEARRNEPARRIDLFDADGQPLGPAGHRRLPRWGQRILREVAQKESRLGGRRRGP